MKYKETTDYSFLLDGNYYVYDHKEDMETLHIFIKSRQNKCRCPKCGMESRKLHATYKRTLQDTLSAVSRHSSMRMFISMNV